MFKYESIILCVCVGVCVCVCVCVCIIQIMEFTTRSNNINAIKEARELFNKYKSNFSCTETKEIREAVYNFLKEK